MKEYIVNYLNEYRGFKYKCIDVIINAEYSMGYYITPVYKKRNGKKIFINKQMIRDQKLTNLLS